MLCVLHAVAGGWEPSAQSDAEVWSVRCRRSTLRMAGSARNAAMIAGVTRLARPPKVPSAPA